MIVNVVKIGTRMGGPSIKRANSMRKVTAYLVVGSNGYPPSGHLLWMRVVIMRSYK